MFFHLRVRDDFRWLLTHINLDFTSVFSVCYVLCVQENIHGVLSAFFFIAGLFVECA